MLPLWADVLAVAALPVILALVLLIWGADDPANTVVHEQEDDEPPDNTGPGAELMAA